MDSKTLRLKRPGRKPSVKKFVVPDEETRPVASMQGIAPQIQPAVAVMASDEKRGHMSAVLNQYKRRILDATPVRSNAELLRRGYEYFDFCADRRLYPTIEGLATYIGYSTRQLLRWEKKESVPFQDGERSTAEIVEMLKGVLEAVDAELVLDGAIPAIPWIFRRKTISGWVEATQLQIVTNNDQDNRPPLTPEEIARRLPDPDDYYDDYTVNR